MDINDDDLLSLAFESAEKEAGVNLSEIENENPISVRNSVDKSISDNFNDEEDIFALALEDVEKVVLNNSDRKLKRSLIGVDLCFEDDSDNTENIEIKSSAISKNSSVVHTGDTDSSDDEDNKYFEEAQYNSYGKLLKNTLKSNEKGKLLGSFAKNSWKPIPSNSPSLPTPKQSICGEKLDVTADPIFGIRIINPLVSSQSIKEVMQGRTPIGCFKIKSHVMHGDLKSDWVFAAVLVQKTPPRVSKNGNNYSIWILSDLKHDLKTVSLFLFGKAHQDLWKTPSGVVIALLNPSVLGDEKKSEFEAKLSIKSSDQVMIWGKSKDLGHCKSRKKNGEACGAFVNISQCEFCVYHVKQEYKKYNSRPDFGNNGKIDMRNKVLGKNEVFYGGKSFTAIVGKKVTNPKDAGRLQGLGPNPVPVKLSDENMQIPNLQRSNAILNLLPKGTVRKFNDEKRLNNLNTNIKQKVSSNHSSNSSHKNKPKLNDKNLTLHNNLNPSLSNPGKDIDLDINIKTEKPNEIKMHEVKQVSNTKKCKLQKRFNSLMSLGSEIGEIKKKSVFSSTSTKDSDNKPFPGERKKTISSSKSLKSSEKNSVPSLTALEETEKKIVPFTPLKGSLEKPIFSSTPLKDIGRIHPEQIVTNSFEGNAVIKNKIDTDKDSLHCLISESGADSGPAINSFCGSPETTSHLQKRQNSFTPPNAGMSKAKKKALAFIKIKGPITKDNPTGTDPNKKSLKRPLSPSNEGNSISEKHVLSQRFIELMNQKSIHEDLVEIREMEDEAEYFEKMEKKDRLEDKMLNTFKVDCKAVRCAQCNYTWFSAADACKSEGHPIKVVDAVKRFFKCSKCDNRTVSLTIIPLIPCKKCFSSSWVRAPMIREKLAKNDSLSIRGDESTFINSVSKGNLNLLVPN